MCFLMILRFRVQGGVERHNLHDPMTCTLILTPSSDYSGSLSQYSSRVAERLKCSVVIACTELVTEHFLDQGC